MNISTRYLHIGTYETDFNGFYVDIRLDTKEKTYEAVLFHEKYGIEDFMLGEPSKYVTAEGFLETVEFNLPEYVEEFIKNREREDGHRWRYYE